MEDNRWVKEIDLTNMKTNSVHLCTFVTDKNDEIYIFEHKFELNFDIEIADFEKGKYKIVSRLEKKDEEL